MKFAKELEHGRVTEWHEQYLNYKQGKKKIKAVVRAIRSGSNKASRTPRSQAQSSPSQNPLTASSNASVQHSTPTRRRDSLPVNGSINSNGRSNQTNDDRDGGPLSTEFGSIVGSPASVASSRAPSHASSLHLPGPAIDLGRKSNEHHARPYSSLSFDSGLPREDPSKSQLSTNVPTSQNAYEIGQSKHPSPIGATIKRALTSPMVPHRGSIERPLIQRLFSRNSGSKSGKPRQDIPLEAQKEIDERKNDFWNFLDVELSKVEAFYKEKEDESSERMEEIKDQLHMLRDHRQRQIRKHQIEQHKRDSKELSGDRQHYGQNIDGASISRWQSDSGHHIRSFYEPIRSAAHHVRFHENTNGQQAPSGDLAGYSQETPNTGAHQDYSRKPQSTSLSYTEAKKRMKAVLQEHYRGLELLKSYVLFNRTAFRKINKKYDKAVRERPYMSYVSDKVNGAWFVKSDVLGSQIHMVEDMYARYFERGNRKVAVGKLRKKDRNGEAYCISSFIDGILASGGVIFSVEALVKGFGILFDSTMDIRLHEQTSYLLQLYAGYFLGLLLMLYFCLICYVFTVYRINYVFIFEFDARHNLDWKQLAELPCGFLFLLGLIMWINFSRIGGDNMYHYYPVILIGLTLLILGFPFKTLYFRSRIWFWKALFRVAFLSGFVRVEFRDLILGDMANSLTYPMGNIVTFFCLYAHGWSNPSQCNSNHSHLFGFFQALPGIWRFLQCIRRWAVSGKPFPHLANAGKYSCTILAYMCLSLYRIEKTSPRLAAFIAFSCANTIYCSTWDIFMDWSLGTSSQKHPFLRDMLALRSAGWYYAAIILDVILRCNWIFYIIFRNDVQHSALNSFCIALSEVTRRAMWTIIRVENDHCSNVGGNVAIRNVPLPYNMRKSKGDIPQMDHERQNLSTFDSNKPRLQVASPPGDLESAPEGIASGAQVTKKSSNSETAMSSLRRRQSAQPQAAKSPSIRTRVGEMISGAHAQDFERARKDVSNTILGDEDDDDDDEEDPESDVDEAELDTGTYEDPLADGSGRRRRAQTTDSMVDSDEDGAAEDGRRDDPEEEQAVLSAKNHLNKAR